MGPVAIRPHLITYMYPLSLLQQLQKTNEGCNTLGTPPALNTDTVTCSKSVEHEVVLIVLLQKKFKQ